MRRDKARIAVYALAGFYLVYLAYQMYQELPTAEGSRPVLIGFMIFFAVIGIALMGLGVWSTWQSAKSQKENMQHSQEETAELEAEKVGQETGESKNTDEKTIESEHAVQETTEQGQKEN